MRLIFMYHQVANPHHLNTWFAFQKHLTQLAEQYPIVSPNTPITARQLSVVLSFDDAYYDFYHFVFPLLKRLRIPAILGIPTAFIQEHTTVDPETRLRVAYPDALRFPERHQAQVPLCTWREIHHMLNSGWVYPASHGHMHLNLCDPNTNLEQELGESKYRLESRLACNIDTFIYPFGKMNRAIHQIVRNYYQHALRIGSGSHFQAPSNGLWYRVPADPFFNRYQPQTLNWSVLAKASANGLFNRLRQK